MLNVKKLRSGFTLIELLIVIMILGVLAALITGNFFTSLKKGSDAKRKGDIELVQRALEMYYEVKRAYPTFDIFASSNYQLCETKIAGLCVLEKIYMQRLPNDPKSGSYEYLTDATGSYYKLYACLENDQQILPYESVDYSITCGDCKNKDGADVP